MKTPKRLNASAASLAVDHSLFGALVVSLLCLVVAGAQEEPIKAFTSLPFLLAYSKDRQGMRTMWCDGYGVAYGSNIKHKSAEDWSVRKEKGGWLFYRGTPNEDGRFGERFFGYLAYPSTSPKKVGEPPDKVDEPTLKLSQTLEPHCYWELVDAPRLGETRMEFQAKANSGDYEGWYLSVGPKVDAKRRSVTLVRDKPEFGNYLYMEAP